MKTRYWVLAIGLCLSVATVGRALDTIIRTSGATMDGRVTGMDPYKITVNRAGGGTTEVFVNEIEAIYYDQEPSLLRTARKSLAGGRYEDALEALEKIDTSSMPRREILQDVIFLKAFCHARQALRGDGKITDAGKEMKDFVTTHTGSYHWLKANEVLGDLSVALGAFAYAEVCYGNLLKAPWPEYKIRASVAIGRTQLAQNKAADARRSFETALATTAAGDEVESEKLAATLGLARCLAIEKKFAEAEQMITGILAKADVEQVELHARAYNALGTTLRLAGRKKEALMAFLHVHVLYSAASDAHAEALANLVELWTQLHKMERANEMRAMLEQSYGGSRWAKKGA